MNSATESRIWCKICGITREEDAQAAQQAGADAIGLNCYPASPRFVLPERAAALAAVVSCHTVALFVDPTQAEVEAVLAVADVDLLQFQGDETPAFCRRFGLPYLKAVRVRADVDVAAVAETYDDAWGLLLDAYVPGRPGGTGQRFDWNLWPRGLKNRRLIVAGGLDAENVAQAVTTLAPFGVDVAGGVEDQVKGRKNAAKIENFIRQAREALSGQSQQ